MRGEKGSKWVILGYVLECSDFSEFTLFLVNIMLLLVRVLLVVIDS